VELADLADHFPPERGRVVRALYSPPDWDGPPLRVPVAGGYVKVGFFPREDTHLIHLQFWNVTSLHLLVVPPGFSQPRGTAAMLAAAASVAGGSTVELLGWGHCGHGSSG
jgi:hypothetical protein